MDKRLGQGINSDNEHSVDGGVAGYSNTHVHKTTRMQQMPHQRDGRESKSNSPPPVGSVGDVTERETLIERDVNQGSQKVVEYKYKAKCGQGSRWER